MSVDKFGLMGDDAEAVTTIVHPIYKHATNLDDLENVEGFNEEGHENQMYGFQLTSKGIYKRIKIDTSKGGIDNNGVVDRPMVLIWKGNQWLTMPMFHDFEIDIKLNNQTVSTKGENHVVHRIINSGKIIGSLIPKKAFRDSSIVLKHKPSLGLGLYTNVKKSVMIFKTEFDADESLLEKAEATVFIDGYMISSSNEFQNILNGLKVKWKRGPEDGLTFKIAIIKESDQFRVRTLPSTIETEFDQSEYNVSEIFLSSNFVLTRVRITTSKITEEEVLFL
jgi:hypothetical protein